MAVATEPNAARGPRPAQAHFPLRGSFVDRLRGREAGP